MIIDFRKKIIKENVLLAKEQFNKLSKKEQEFITDIEFFDFDYKLSKDQFNWLHSIAQKAKRLKLGV